MATVELYLYVYLFIINLPQGKDQYKRLEPVQGTARSTTTQQKLQNKTLHNNTKTMTEYI